MWDSNDEIKVYGVDQGTQDKLIGMFADDSAKLYVYGRHRFSWPKQGGGGDRNN